jgi:CHAD domain-containing protein
LKRQLKRYRRALKRCQQKFSPSAVHESRVQTRRLLALAQLLQPFLPAGHVRKAEAALKRHLDTFDDLRDTQMQRLAVAKMRAEFGAARAFYEYLEDREARFTRRSRKRIKRIKSKHLQELFSACRQDVKKWRGLCSVARANRMLVTAINRAFGQARKLRDKIDGHDTASIHRTRVAFKKFRYMVENLASGLPFASERRLAAMHDYQAMMGDIQDAEVLLRTLDKFLRKQTAEAPEARRFRAEWVRRRHRLVVAYLHAAGELDDFWPTAGPPVADARRGAAPAQPEPLAPPPTQEIPDTSEPL